jgi:lysozyme
MIIDLSANNGQVDWEKVKLAHLEGCYLKVSEGVGFKDTRLEANALGAQSIGLKIGYYHYATLNSLMVEADAKQEVEYCVGLIKNLPKASLPFALDIEVNKIGLKPTYVIDYIRTFFKTLEAHGIKDYVIYSYGPFLNEYLPPMHGLGTIRLWIATYGSKPFIPKGWGDYFMWQYDNKGKIPGINGNCDLSKLK